MREGIRRRRCRRTQALVVAIPGLSIDWMSLHHPNRIVTPATRFPVTCNRSGRQAVASCFCERSPGNEYVELRQQDPTLTAQSLPNILSTSEMRELNSFWISKIIVFHWSKIMSHVGVGGREWWTGRIARKKHFTIHSLASMYSSCLPPYSAGDTVQHVFFT